MVQITERLLQFLFLLRRYGFLTAALLRDQLLPEDKDGSLTRGLLRRMEAANLAQRFRAKVVDPLVSTTAPVWVITERGACVLATGRQDMGMLLDVKLNTQGWQNFSHWVRCSGMAMAIDNAVSASQGRVQITALYFEHHVVRPDEQDPSLRYRLYTVVSPEGQRRVVSACDWAFEVSFGDQRRAYYCEFETGSEESPSRCAAKKAPGHFGLSSRLLFRRHFPQAADMRVLVFCPNRAWMHTMRSAMKGRPGAELWRWAVADEVTKDTFLTGELFWTVDRGPVAFAPAPQPAQAPAVLSSAGEAIG